jgi:uncharacterized protein (TIGR02147 family)
MERIQKYTDYRRFLGDYYAYRKKHNRNYSYRVFCRKSGINSPSFFRDVVHGKRNLTANTIEAFIRGLELNELDARYFRALVLFNQAKSSQEKQLYLEKMRGLTRQVSQVNVPVNLYDYYAQWHLPVLRELACLLDWDEDYKMLARHVEPRITVAQAREGIAFLVQKGFIQKNGDGRYVQKNPAITSGAEVCSLGVRRFNKHMATRAQDAIEEYSPAERDMRTLVVGVSSEGYRLIKEEIREFVRRVVRIADDDAAADRVYNVNMHVFPLSKHTQDGQDA